MVRYEAVRLELPVHYDFASTICHVAHRVMARLEDWLAEQEIALAWTPLDLARLLGRRAGVPLAEAARENALRVADDLGVETQMPALWPDSRAANAAALLAAEAGCEPLWRERVFSAVFEQGRSLDAPGAVATLADEIGLAIAPEALATAAAEVERRTEAARAAQVTGVPTFVLAGWPLGGIQEEATMREILGRYAQRAREGRLA